MSRRLMSCTELPASNLSIKRNATLNRIALHVRRELSKENP